MCNLNLFPVFTLNAHPIYFINFKKKIKKICFSTFLKKNMNDVFTSSEIYKHLGNKIHYTETKFRQVNLIFQPNT